MGKWKHISHHDMLKFHVYIVNLSIEVNKMSPTLMFLWKSGQMLFLV